MCFNINQGFGLHYTHAYNNTTFVSIIFAIEQGLNGSVNRNIIIFILK